MSIQLQEGAESGGFGMLPWAALGLGIGKDVFGGLSTYEQARRQNALYNYNKNFQNPTWVNAQAQPYVNQLNANTQAQTPALMRSTINPMLGSQGIDPTSGAGQSIYANAFAPLFAQNAQTGMQQFLQASGQGSQYGTANVGSTYGGMDGTQQALYLAMLAQGMRPGAPAITGQYANHPGYGGQAQQDASNAGAVTPTSNVTGDNMLTGGYPNWPLAYGAPPSWSPSGAPTEPWRQAPTLTDPAYSGQVGAIPYGG